MTFDCSKCVLKCKAICCKTIPLPNEMFEKHKSVRKILILVDRGDGTSTPTTVDGYCPFLGQDMKCTVYHDRPWICVEYGKGGHINLECPWQAPDGRLRSRQERRDIERKVEKELIHIRNMKLGKVNKAEIMKYQKELLDSLPEDVRKNIIKELLLNKNFMN